MPTIEIIGAFISLLYLRLEYKANVWLWPVGVITPLIYIYIFFTGKLYAVMGINIYYLFASIYGWYCWRRQPTGESELQILRLPKSHIWKLSAVFAVLFTLIIWVLTRYSDNPAPYGDAFVTALSVVAMWMLAKKFAEQWLVWVVVNLVSAALFFSQALYPTGVLYAIYAIVSIFGYRKWKLMALKSPTP
ncbi:MAG: nicotinamide riboside transporter PnuC [Tannerella sp.]|jgi:nicotinamide mononucleotide transporter|nr:nicotinamide riboside transporter PnuC [Tannerella sp.]